MTPERSKILLEAFVSFLGELPLRDFEKKYRSVKTVEQNLPPRLNPLPLLYELYWQPPDAKPRFPSFEEFFSMWWKEKLPDLDAFIRKYFWGCSHEFVYRGLEARLNRTAVSVWTQFHFGYLWNAKATFRLEASANLDMQGIDALIHLDSARKIGIQVKKETYRSEARGANRFLKAGNAIAIVEVPYTLLDPAVLKERSKKARSESKRREYLVWLNVAKHLTRLPNGFVIFRESYVTKLEGFLAKASSTLTGTIPWQTVAEQVLRAS